MNFDIIKCHGSGNDFIMVDTTLITEPEAIDWSAFARVACNRMSGIGSDGVLLVIKDKRGVYGMDMLNPDGTHAEMCGNGIRCVARLAAERGYLNSGILFSGGRDFMAERTEPIAEGIEAFAVEIPIGYWNRSFAFFAECEEFVGKKIEALDDTLQFTALNLGNPHVVAAVEEIDMEYLARLGERVKGLTNTFTEGVNVSLYKRLSPKSIFVATYERGAGITLSCGTAMTASATAAALLGLVESGERIEVFNRGGKVACTTRVDDGRIITRLEGNATFEWLGEAEFDGERLSYSRACDMGEAEVWQRFVDSINS